MDALLHILDWLVANKTVGLPIAIVIVLGLSAVAWPLKRLRRERATFEAAAPDGNVQQVNVERLRSKGDISVTARQE